MSLTDLQIGAWNVYGDNDLPLIGSQFFVDSVEGGDGNPATSWEQAGKTLSTVYSYCTTLKDDVVRVRGRASAYAETAVLTLDKDYTHMVGITGPLFNGGRARITNTVATATAGEVVISGTGCVYKNLHFQFGDSATATSLVGVAISGNGRNTFINCEFDGPFYNTNTNNRMVTLTSTQDNYFYHCSFGQRTIINTQGGDAVVGLLGSNVTGNTFEECKFHLYNSSTSSAFIHFASGAMPGSGYTLFKKCTFMNHTNAAIADAIRNTSAASGMVILDRCCLVSLGTAVWATNLKTNIFTTDAASANNGGIAIVVT